MVEIMYQDDRVIVCVKPAGVLSTDEPGGMPSLLRQALGEERLVVKSVHRLDRTVGGVMVYARTRRAAADLGAQIKAGAFHKEYRAVVCGVPALETWTLRDWLYRDTRKRKTYVVPAGSPQAREAVLDYKVLARAGEMSLLSIVLHTGRPHQIRCQLAHRDLPILGDRKYGTDSEDGGIALWSYAIGFEHPRTGERMEFTRQPPDTSPWNMFFTGT